MKTFFFVFAFLAFLSGSASAQQTERRVENPGQGEPTISRVDDVTRQMADKLHLNEAQYIRLRNINKIKLAQLDQIMWDYRDDNEARRSKLAELEMYYQQECSRVLSPSQLSMYREGQPQAPVQHASNEDTVG
ncbi:hypothetical protein LJY25_00635 [Hymenobacter sp. BT175]|uniref:hypothetical protein n=1 Tax=Hymenobacter translucens TaxID=2886507 RepID=UPI001D0E5334|nr:hypothetical protein [Hymenobacter translucens]MCC2544934.1 hypothetical protein [Hymenobacter translucens]